MSDVVAMLTRRSFLATPAALIFAQGAGPRAIDLRSFERARVLRAADKYLRESPITVTASSSPRTAGGRHDYFSEGDYWWPDPRNPNGPYIQRDGLTNPDNFVAHRHALIRLSLHVPALTAAWLLTEDRRYAAHSVRHLRAWFIDERTRMNPHLRYAQAIRGRVTGRGIGIIDTLHLVEVVRAITVLEDTGALSGDGRDGTRAWFERYLTWMTTHEYGLAERDARNNHGTCWVLQVAEFARYTGRADLTAFCRERFRTVLVPNQIAADGSFPEELRRTKPYGYSLFNLDALAAACQVLDPASTVRGSRFADRKPERAGSDLWHFETADGRGMRKALACMFPYIEDRRKWPHQPDVMYFENWPVRHVALLWGGLALGRPEYVDLWRRLDPDPVTDEVVRNYFIRQPLLWDRA
ncbi:MAG TPA: alginate lyase family protein [Vicinamibacterales bacterium]|nr:alginate lyase family protein [Vicinamibacterales bacterium]